MVKFRDKDTRFKNLELKIGVMIAVAIAGIALIAVLIGIQRDLFTSKYRLSFVTESGSGFVQGMPVKLSGFKIGRVEKVELIEYAKVKVGLEINRKYDKWIREGSKARLAKEGFIGDSYVEISVGDLSLAVIPDKGNIPYDKSGGIEELLEKAKPVMTEITEIIHYANDPNGDLKLTIRNMKELTAGLKETRREIDKVLRHSDRLIANIEGKSSALLESAEKTMRNVEGATGRIEPAITKVEKLADDAGKVMEKVPATLEKVQTALDDVKVITSAVAGKSPELRDAIEDAGEAARDGKAVLKGVKGSWPVRLMLPKPAEPGLIPLDGSLPAEGMK